MTTVLIIDDDPDFQEFVCALFELEGFEPHAAFDGQTGLDLFRKVEPDVVLLDIMLPSMDGYELCRRLRDDLGTSVPVIFVSARAEDHDRERGREAGGDDYVTKPLDFPHLMEVVLRHLDAAE
jgi:DNA-binding response OmpR family regulator